jgi:gas vesicle protein
MADDEAPDDEPFSTPEPAAPVDRGTFAAGLVVGALLGAGLALLLAPDRGSRTRRSLSRRLRRLREEAGGRRRQLGQRLERAADRVRDRLS